MRTAVTGATGFLGRYIVEHLEGLGHQCRCWKRPTSDISGMGSHVEWIDGELNDPVATVRLVENCDAVVHAALDRPGDGFRGAEGDVPTFAENNVIGTLRLIEAARKAGVQRFVFVSTCAVHEKILDDRPLDEAHPLWATHHYGAHKAAIEKFVHSYGYGAGFNICAIRPTGIYGLAHPASESKWYGLVQAIKRGDDFDSDKGGKEVHVADVARAIGILLTADGTAGEAYNCYDMYVSQELVASIAREITGSRSRVSGNNRGPKHQIETGKIRALGMKFGGRDLLEETIRQMLEK